MNERSIFEAAIERESPQERSAYLDSACGGNPNLRARVDQLLREFSAPDPFLDAPPDELARTVTSGITEQPGTVIGPYKLREQIGEGGFGVVYLAEQTEPVKRRVALKIIKPGMDTKEVISRFEAERQALALMDHPGIARVLDAGATESGRPYFVMELVKGISITDYCDQCHLAPRDRLQLFLQVCQAIQHAHQKGVIHRDVKPSNVLIAMQDGKPVPKVIDFGVAKAINQRLTEHTLLTRFSQVVGTPLYMSPEQAEMSPLDVDTRSDIYSLGVLLYELLTGTTPFERERLKEATFDEMRRIIREEEPLRPSARISTLGAAVTTVAEKRRTEPRKLQQAVSGDLDWIVMKALEKDPTRRYETASSLAEDVDRYLNDEPVQACPPSAAYRFRKFARRNKGTMAATSAAVLVLSAVTVVSTIAAGRFRQLADEKAGLLQVAIDAEAAASAAEEQERLQRIEAEEQTGIARDALAESRQQRQRAETNLDLALDSLDAVYLQAIGGERLLAGDNDSGAALSPSEERLVQIGLGLYEQIASQNVEDESARYRVATAQFRIGQLKHNLRDHDGAREAFNLALRQVKQLTGHAPDDVRYVKLLGDVLAARACLVAAWEDDARSDFNAAIEAYTTAINIESDNPDLYAARAATLGAAGRTRAAEQDYLRAIELDPESAGLHSTLGWMYAFPPRQNRQRAIDHLERAVELEPTALSLARLARVRFMIQHDYEAAWELLERADRDDPLAAEPRIQRAIWHFDQEQFEDALREINRVLDLTPHNRYALRWRGRIYGKLNRFDEALADFAAAEPMYRSSPFWWLVQRSDVYTAMERHDDAFADLARAVRVNPEGRFSWQNLEQASRQVTDTDAAADALQGLCDSPYHSTATRAHTVLASIFVRLQRFDEAEQSLDEALRIHRELRRIDDSDPDIVADELATRVSLAHLEWALERYPEAHRISEQCLGEIRRLAENHPENETLLRRLGAEERQICECYAELGMLDEAAEFIRRAVARESIDDYCTDPKYAVLPALVGDFEGYSQYLRVFAPRWERTVPRWVLFVASMSPDPEIESAELQRLVEATLDGNTTFWTRFLAATGEYRAGRFQQALDQLDASKISDKALYRDYWRALILQKLGRGLEAVEWLGRAEAEYREHIMDTARWHFIAYTHLIRREAWIEIEQQAPGDSWQHLIQARGYHMIGENVRAERELAAATTAAADDPYALFARRQLLLQWGELDAADWSESDWQRLVEQAADDPAVWSERARWYAERADYDQAAADFDRAIELTPHSQEQLLGVRFPRRRYYWSAMQWDEVYHRLSELRPDDAFLAYDRILFQSARGEFDAALQSFSHIAPEHFNETVWCLYATLQLLNGDRDGYHATCRELERQYLARDHWPPRELKSWVYSPVAGPDSGVDPEILRTIANRFWNDGNCEPDFARAAGLCRLRIGDYALAVVQLERAHELQQNTPSGDYSLFPLAIAHHHLGNADKSLEWYEKGVAALSRWQAEIIESDYYNRFHWELLNLLHREAAELLGISPGEAALQIAREAETEPRDNDE